MIIAIVGKAGHGKDTLAEMIIEEYSISKTVSRNGKIEREENFRPFEKARFADGVKKACASITGYPVSVFYDRESYSKVVNPFNFTVREMMQKLGDGMREIVDKDIWVKTALMRCKSNGNYLFCDTRYPNEVDTTKKVGGKIIWITREDFIDPTLQTEESKNHRSETALDNYPLKENADFIVHNNDSLEGLRSLVKNELITKILEWENNLKSDKQSPKEVTP